MNDPDGSQGRPGPHPRRKKQAFRDLEAKTGVTVSNVCESRSSAEDSAAIERQLGFLPTNVFAVASRAESGEPTVLKLYPLAVSLKGARAGNGDRHPFPTMYWLSCPSLKAAVSQLENQGLVGDWEQRLQADPALLTAMQNAHKRYAQERWEMLTSADADIIRQRGWESSLGLSVGVAGISKPTTIKCLHTHFAHFLATGENVVGGWVQHALRNGVHLSRVVK